jgi:hypothetical protein
MQLDRPGGKCQRRSFESCRGHPLNCINIKPCEFRATTMRCAASLSDVIRCLVSHSRGHEPTGSVVCASYQSANLRGQPGARGYVSTLNPRGRGFWSRWHSRSASALDSELARFSDILRGSRPASHQGQRVVEADAGVRIAAHQPAPAAKSSSDGVLGQAVFP